MAAAVRNMRVFNDAPGRGDGQFLQIAAYRRAIIMLTLLVMY